jgi:hypothetical protein
MVGPAFMFPNAPALSRGLEFFNPLPSASDRGPGSSPGHDDARIGEKRL